MNYLSTQNIGSFDMLEDHADSQDPEIAQRLTEAALPPAKERPLLHDYLHRRPPANTEFPD